VDRMNTMRTVASCMMVCAGRRARRITSFVGRCLLVLATPCVQGFVHLAVLVYEAQELWSLGWLGVLAWLWYPH
jgi:hypothetical protein